MTNEFSCLSNALLQAGLRCELSVAFQVPERVREMVEGVQAHDVRTVSLHQCPQGEDGVIEYTLEVRTMRGDTVVDEFASEGMGAAHGTYVLYDRSRDGLMKHLHLVH